MTDIPLSPFGGVQLPPEPSERLEALAGAQASSDRQSALGDVVRRWPDCIGARADLGDAALAAGDDAKAYACYRVGYHRSLDRLRGNGWRGAGRVPFSHEPNQAFHQATYGLAAVSGRWGDRAELERCVRLLLDSDPTDPLGAQQLL